MGQQQLLLIILGAIIVGIAVSVAVTLFSDNSVSSNRDNMSTDLLHLAAKARHHYFRPVSMGGGGHSFQKDTDGNRVVDANLLVTDLVTTAFSENANGSYSVTGVVAGAAGSITFRGVGRATLPNGVDHPIMELTVTRSGPQAVVIVQ